MSVSPQQWPQRFEEAHLAIAEYFGVSRPEQIVLTPGCTSALAVAIGDVPITRNMRVLTSHWEHHALHRPLLKRAAAGIQVEYIPPARNDRADDNASPLDLDWLERKLSRNDVGLVAITAACNVTGELMPYEDVIRIAHQYGALVLVDAAQIVGWQKLDFSRMGADMVAFGSHIGLQAPWGIGGLYIADHVPLDCTSATCDLPTFGDHADQPPPRPGYCDVGSVDQIALAGLHAAIRMLREQNMGELLAAGRRQIQRIRESLRRYDRLRLFGPHDPEQGMPSLALAVAGLSSGEFAARLRRHALIVGSGIQCAPLAHQTLGTGEEGVVRLSVGIAQPDNEIDEAIDRLQSAVSESLSRLKHS